VTDHDLAHGVAVRLSAFCLTDSGRLRSFDLWDVAVRGALLVDLALAGRVAHEEDSVVVDPTPTGFSPADALLQPITVEPERELNWWMDHAAVGLDDLVRDNVASGRWRRHWTPIGRRYVQEIGARSADAAELARDPATATWDPATAAIGAIGDASGITDMRPGEPAAGILEHTGDVRWICEAVAEHLQRVHRRMLLQAGAADGTGSPHY
jgi:Golgi phosphoprotein 3 (GPP34)